MMSHSSSSYPYLILILDPRCLARTEEDRAKVPLKSLVPLLRLFFLFFPVSSDAHMLFLPFFSSSPYSFSLSITLCLGSEKKRGIDTLSLAAARPSRGVGSRLFPPLFFFGTVTFTTRPVTQVDFVIVCVDEQSMIVGLGRRCHVTRLDRRVTLERQRKRYESC